MEPPVDKPRHTKLIKGRWYWDPPVRLRRANGLKTVSLGGNQVVAWEMARRLNKEHLSLEAGEAAPGTVGWVLKQFAASAAYADLAQATRRDYRWLAKLLAAVAVPPTTLGRLPAMAIKARHADQIFSTLMNQSGHHSAHYACRFARRVWKWAARREMVEANPWTGMDLPGLPARKQRWSPEMVAAVVAKARERGRPSLARATLLAYCLGHRKGDILSLTWTDLDSGGRQTSKTAAYVPLAIQAYPDLVADLAEGARAGVQVVIHEGTGRPYNPYTFTHDWREAATAAGVPADLQFRDLRATAATELADGGADLIEMSTHTGHQTAQMARRYARPTSQQMDSAAQKRMAARNKRSTGE